MMMDAFPKRSMNGRSPVLLFNRPQVLRALVFATLLCWPTAAQSSLGLARTGPRADAHPIKENFITIRQLRIRYVESGRGLPIVMIHGNAGSVEDFNFGAVDALSANYHVIALDRPGHGLSDRPRGKRASVEDQARLLHDVLLSLRVSQPVLVGHSWGAALALCYALQYPGEISGLVLAAPAAYPDRGESRFLQALTKLPVMGDVALIAGRPIVGKHVLRTTLERAFYPQPVPQRYVDLAAASWLGRKQLRAYLQDESGLNRTLIKLTKRYRTIAVPTVIITSDHDQIVSAKDNAYRLQAAMPHAQLIALKDAGHEIPQTHPESIYMAVDLIRNEIGGDDVSER